MELMLAGCLCAVAVGQLAALLLLLRQKPKTETAVMDRLLVAYEQGFLLGAKVSPPQIESRLLDIRDADSPVPSAAPPEPQPGPPDDVEELGRYG